MKKCPLCNGKVIKKNILTPYTYKNATITINQPQDYCEACREGFLSHEDIQATKRELADFKRKQDGLLSSDEIRSIRKKAGLTQEKAAEIFTGIADNMMRNINWYFRLNPVQLASVETELLQDMQVLNQVLLINKHYNPEFNKKYQEEFDNYRMAYESVRRE